MDKIRQKLLNGNLLKIGNEAREFDIWAFNGEFFLEEDPGTTSATRKNYRQDLDSLIFDVMSAVGMWMYDL